ncbi:MAG TPA: phosphoglucomutase, alpha-D-glucose phosphate-specific, partial [Meiothermus sp.]|nr:phosphoglucomutase, alpha-D-glucose phosphate-specific [Meiothermus sp.]
MSLHPLAGKPAPHDILVNIPRLLANYYALRPDPSDPLQRVAFGTSGHRGTSASRTFNEAHILAVSQAVAEHRATQGITGPLYIGMDTHALSEAAWVSALEVLVANGVHVHIEKGRGYTPTPLISHAILSYNKGRSHALADGIVITPSHNPPQDGGFKYNPPSGGPADTGVTKAIQERANEILLNELRKVQRVSLTQALEAAEEFDFVTPYVYELREILDLEAIKAAGVKIGVDPLGGSSLATWQKIADHYGLDLTIVNERIDPSFSFMTVDKDGKIRMDCSSPYAMASLIDLKDKYDIAFGNDTDADRHGIVAPSVGLLNPNHFLAVAIEYLFSNRTQWSKSAAVGKTLVSSSIIDRVTQQIGRKLF